MLTSKLAKDTALLGEMQLIRPVSYVALTRVRLKAHQ